MPNRRLPSRLRGAHAFTLIELLTVLAVILALAGITLGTFSYANTKAARSRAESEIKALAAACENFKFDNGEYPRILPTESATTTSPTDSLNAAAQLGVDPAGNSAYLQANQRLYELLSGLTVNGALLKDAAGNNLKSYFEFRPNQLNGTKDATTGRVTRVNYITDPWGKPYGYSTARYYATNVAATPPSPLPGFNPTVDLWSTAGRKQSEYTNAASANALWIKNW